PANHGLSWQPPTSCRDPKIPAFFFLEPFFRALNRKDTNLRSCWTGHSPRPHTRLVEARECRSKTVDRALGEIDFVWGRGFAPPKSRKGKVSCEEFLLCWKLYRTRQAIGNFRQARQLIG